MHKSALIVLSYFTLFFPFFSKGLEMHFVEPVNFGLFCVVVSLCVSTALEKKAVEYLISLIKHFYSSQFGAENKFLENWDLWRFFLPSLSTGESWCSNPLSLWFLIFLSWFVPSPPPLVTPSASLRPFCQLCQGQNLNCQAFLSRLCVLDDTFPPFSPLNFADFKTQ